MIQRLAALLLLLACTGAFARAEDATDAEAAKAAAKAKEAEAFATEHLDGLSGARALELVKELASDEMKGRKTGAAGGEAVENWMLNKMAGFGLHPADAGGTYLEPFAFVSGGKRVKGHNALGAIKGRDADLVHEIILVTASMDGLGFGADGKVLPGANANASGTAVMIHLADVLKLNRLRPKRTIIFCGFGAGQQGHAGSRALAARYPFQGDVVAVLNMDMVGQGDPIAVVRGGATFPKVQALFDSAIPEARAEQVVFGPRAGPGGGHWAFEERGVPAFAISTFGLHLDHGTSADKASGVKAASLDATANIVGRLLLALAMHEDSLRDPKDLAEYLVREGPRYALGVQDKAGPILIDYGSNKAVKLDADGHSFLAGNIDGALWHIDPTEAGRVAWEALAKRAAEENASFAIVRNAAEVEAAWRSHRFGLLVIGGCRGTLKERLALLESYAKGGFRFVSPWSAMSDEERTPALATELAAACKRLRLIPDMAVLGPAGWKAARAALGSAPACASMASEHLAKAGPSLAAMGRETLILTLGSPHQTLPPALAEGAPPSVLLDPFAERAVEVLHAWGAKQPEGWALPGTPQRARVRAVLGGNLLTWLAKAEKK